MRTGGVDHGVHAFYVPIRDPGTGAFLPGVGGEDDGLKGGLSGIDNGRLWFDHVRVPRRDLLDRYGSVAADGTYSSPIASPGRRFFTMLGTLVQGRVSLDGAAVNASKVALQVAVTYANQRRQFAGASGNEVKEGRKVQFAPDLREPRGIPFPSLAERKIVADQEMPKPEMPFEPGNEFQGRSCSKLLVERLVDHQHRRGLSVLSLAEVSPF